MIGAARCGTTTLHRLLHEHPQIFVPEEKRPEPHFFLKIQEYRKGFEYYCKRYFKDATHHKAIGEISTSYLFQPWVPGRIAKHLPNISLVCLLRNPIERAYSGYWHTVKSGLEKLTFDEAVFHEDIRIRETPEELRETCPFAYIGRGMYYSQIQRYLGYFRREQFLFVLFEDFVSNPQKSFSEICRFLNVRDDFIPPSIGIRLNNSDSKAPIKMETRRFLQKVFSSEIAELSKFLQKDLTHWK